MAFTLKEIKEKASDVKLTEPKLSLGWMVGAVIGVGLLAVVYKLALKGVSFGEGAMGKLVKGRTSVPGEASIGKTNQDYEAMLGI